MIAKFGLKNLETSLYCRCEVCFDILNCLGMTHECERQTVTVTLQRHLPRQSARPLISHTIPPICHSLFYLVQSTFDTVIISIITIINTQTDKCYATVSRALTDLETLHSTTRKCGVVMFSVASACVCLSVCLQCSNF